MLVPWSYRAAVSEFQWSPEKSLLCSPDASRGQVKKAQQEKYHGPNRGDGRLAMHLRHSYVSRKAKENPRRLLYPLIAVLEGMRLIALHGRIYWGATTASRNPRTIRRGHRNTAHEVG